jgi:hypothetical protein
MKQYLVGLRCGGLMEDPSIRYENHEIIEANTPREAEDGYNKKNNCSYFYGRCRGEVINGFVMVPIKDFIKS